MITGNTTLVAHIGYPDARFQVAAVANRKRTRSRQCVEMPASGVSRRMSTPALRASVVSLNVFN